ncbi:MAG: TIGR00366 family protein [Acidaminococcus sp.]|jgi:uncharacterized ion transporter superfamily protein YfcC|nr:TIGR00366 family protein [Acidaminococcus sp.]MCI2114212.1 TIGR00366 family protein [Acidaminococcus sp.]MCI2116147.1 TIGR00366 family protein [Acidaminococcus sp.]
MAEEKPEETKKSKWALPHVFVLLFGIIVFATIMTWVLPAGEFNRVANKAGQKIVQAGTYHLVDAHPIGFFEMFKCIYLGMKDAAPVILFVFIAYAFIGLIIGSGAFDGLVAKMLRVIKGKARVAIVPIFMLIISFASSTVGISEEALPFIPIFVGICIAMGYDAIVGMSIVSCATAIGYAGAFMNPFTVGTAQAIAELPIMSGSGFRILSHLAMVAVASVYVVRYALKIQANPEKSYMYGIENEFAVSEEELDKHPFTFRHILVLAVFFAGVIILVYGCKNFGWYFTELSALFMIMGLISALLVGWNPNQIARALEKSFKDIAGACMMIGFARGILIVMQTGRVMDTFVYGMFMPLSGMPRLFAAEAMLIVQTLLNFLIPSGSGQAVVSMPIMAPLADLLGLSRQLAVLCFQFGDGLSNIMWPTTTLPIACGIAGVSMSKWWKFFTPLFIMLVVVQGIMIAIGYFIGY